MSLPLEVDLSTRFKQFMCKHDTEMEGVTIPMSDTHQVTYEKCRECGYIQESNHYKIIVLEDSKK